MKNTNAKNKMNKKEIKKIAETLAAVYIYIYIVLSFRHERKLKYAENKNINRDINKHKDRTMLKIASIGLSLCSSVNSENVKFENLKKIIRIVKMKRGYWQFLANRDGPLTRIY